VARRVQPATSSALLAPQFTAVAEARTRNEFERELFRFCTTLGFKTVSATLVLDRPGDASRFITADNTPADYRPIFEHPDGFAGDPVMQHCKQRGTPIAWDQSTYVARGEGARWERQAEYGYRCGIALALHLPRGQHFFVGLDRPEALPRRSTDLSWLVSQLSLFTLHASEVAAKALCPPVSAPPAVHLTARELEVLRWTLDGKTAWEVGMILGISGRTAAIHANNATHKLGCFSKHQAALKAFHLGWIHG
jgi:DNA-binding CsgD family transcriptional regulator